MLLQWTEQELPSNLHNLHKLWRLRVVALVWLDGDLESEQLILALRKGNLHRRREVQLRNICQPRQRTGDGRSAH